MPATIPSIWIPYTIVAGQNDTFQFKEEGTGHMTVTLTPGTYNNPSALIAQVATDMGARAIALGGFGGYVGNFDTATETNYIDGSGTTFEIYTSSPASTNINAVLGFTQAAGTGDFVVEDYSDVQPLNYWSPGIPPSKDDHEQIKYVAGQSVSLAGYNKHQQHGSYVERKIEFKHLPIHKVIQSEEGTYVNESFDRVWEGMKGRFRWYEDRTTEANGLFHPDYFLSKPVDTLKRDRLNPAGALYGLKLEFVRMRN